MRRIPIKLRNQLSESKRMKRCEHYDKANCSGRLTWEHVWIYAGKQINEDWAIISLCEYHHLYEGLEKDWNKWVSLGYALASNKQSKYSKKDWTQITNRLHIKYVTGNKDGRYPARKGINE